MKGIGLKEISQEVAVITSRMVADTKVVGRMMKEMEKVPFSIQTETNTLVSGPPGKNVAVGFTTTRLVSVMRVSGRMIHAMGLDRCSTRLMTNLTVNGVRVLSKEGEFINLTMGMIMKDSGNKDFEREGAFIIGKPGRLIKERGKMTR